MEKHNKQPEKHYREAEGNLDSPINTKDAHDFNNTRSLTNDESADTDPNEVPDKATFQGESEEKTNQDPYDGEIKI